MNFSGRSDTRSQRQPVRCSSNRKDIGLVSKKILKKAKTPLDASPIRKQALLLVPLSDSTSNRKQTNITQAAVLQLPLSHSSMALRLSAADPLHRSHPVTPQCQFSHFVTPRTSQAVKPKIFEQVQSKPKKKLTRQDKSANIQRRQAQEKPRSRSQIYTILKLEILERKLER